MRTELAAPALDRTRLHSARSTLQKTHRRKPRRFENYETGFVRRKVPRSGGRWFHGAYLALEQIRGIEQVAKAIVQMEKVTQTTAANAEESASASQELSAQSDTLRAIVSRLQSMVGGG